MTNLPLPRFVSMRAESANARRGPSLDQRVDWEFVHRGLPLEITAEYGQWRRVRDADGAGGWVHSALLSGRADRAGAGRRRRCRCAPGPTEAAAVRAMAEPGVVGRLEACRGDWCEIAAGGRRGLAAARGDLGRRPGRDDRVVPGRGPNDRRTWSDARTAARAWSRSRP